MIRTIQGWSLFKREFHSGNSILSKRLYCHPPSLTSYLLLNIPMEVRMRSVKQPSYLCTTLTESTFSLTKAFIPPDTQHHQTTSQPISICIVIRSMECSTAKSFLGQYTRFMYTTQSPPKNAGFELGMFLYFLRLSQTILVNISFQNIQVVKINVLVYLPMGEGHRKIR